MGEVFLAFRRDDESQTRIVLKRLRPEIYEHDEYHKRMVFEAQVGSSLEHPNLVKQVELGQVGDCPYLVLEYIQGFSLRRLLDPILENELPPPPTTVGLIILESLLDALTAMHGVRDKEGVVRPIIHRDVTPNNVIITSEGRPVLIDFGIAKDVMGPSITQYGKVVGTARYMSPEHREGENLDMRTDVFAASMIGFELFMGRRPWPRLSTHKEMLRTVFDPPEISEDEAARLPEELRNIILKGLTCDPDKRWTSAKDMLVALRQTEYYQMLASGDQVQKWLQVSDWVETTELPSDEEYESLIVDHQPIAGSAEAGQYQWSPAGRLDRDPTPQPYSPSELPAARVLSIPPLPPRRAANLGSAEWAEAEAHVRSESSWFWAVTLLLLSLAGAYLGYIFG